MLHIERGPAGLGPQRTKWPEEHANGSEVLCEKKKSVIHTVFLCPICSHLAHPKGVLLSFAISSWLCALQEVVDEGLFEKCHYSGCACSVHGVVKGSGVQKASCWCWDLSQCHLVSAAASRDPREQQRLLLVSQLFMASLNKHKIPQ